MENVPASTYRIQFNEGFTFLDLERLIPYFEKLGIGAIYASPVFRAVPHSTHGYDQTDPLQINPQIGTLEQLRTVAKKLAAAGIGWIQDIVPNHMAFHSENGWLWDVLEKGQDSAYSRFFDTSFAAPHYFTDRPMLPFLDAPQEKVIEAGRLNVQLDGGALVLEYNGQRWPINAPGRALILQRVGVETEDDLAARQAAIDELNKSKPFIREVVANQYYEPCHWRETGHRINYRRFFTVNGLIAVNANDDRVFRVTHRLVIQLLKERVFTGLRIDHVDGLSDPTGYLLRLRRSVGDRTFVAVEKILQPDEALPSYWPIQGTTGYDFLALANGLLADGRGESRLTRFYDKLAGHAAPSLQLLAAKRSQLRDAMGGELDNLFRYFRNSVLEGSNLPGGIDDAALKSALAAFAVHCPVYRWYGRTFPLPEPEAAAIRYTLQRAALDEPALRQALSFLESHLVPAFLSGSKRRVKHLAAFYRRCMQLTGALMAKGLEDTLMYTDYRYIGANEVGGTPALFHVAITEFHRSMEQRAMRYPHALNATATHDTKRGEDVRARLQTITAYPREWTAAVTDWMKQNAPLKTNGMPDVNDEYLIYQTLWGTYPMPGQPTNGYGNRLEDYLVKALREAKRHTDWAAPNHAYESATLQFVRRILRNDWPFLEHFRALHAGLADAAVVNSLVQVALKFTCPGIPDMYQGCEGWDLSFVDPDNRRQVDYHVRRKWQQKLGRSERGAADGALDGWWKERYSGLLKYGVTERLAQLRRSHAALFQRGGYEQVAVDGRRRRHVLSFVRRLDSEWLLVVVPLHLPKAMVGQLDHAARMDWGNTRIRLPNGAPTKWRNVLTGDVREASGSLPLSDAFADVPLGIWLAAETHPERERSAGVLMPMFSLPGPYGVGDLASAHRFADFLRGARQRNWLMLPHNPTDKEVGYSPYSTRSAMAGNTTLVSLDEFQRQGWIVEAELAMNTFPASAYVDHEKAAALRHVLFGKAFRNYLQQWGGEEEPAFGDFCQREAHWLDDYADYVTLREFHRGKPWYRWPLAYRHREEQAIAEFRSHHAYERHQVKWLQYQFHVQWQWLKAHCRRGGIRLIGDLPFYVNHDSVDVWTNPELFSLDSKGRMACTAGVPPDYFNTEGQHWGMPVYRWANHAEQGYQWWIARIRRNLELYDFIRLDHFRAFVDYWEVPKGAVSAKQGEWKAGPGMALFQAVRNAIGSLPFIAEDLGDIHERVYRLREKLGLPGMKVLQFAFGEDVGANPHAPHQHTANDVVFTGTHDNNTAAGWYRDELPDKGKAQLRAYIGAGRLSAQQASHALCRMAYASPARLAIVPMQDILKLGGEARMNVPAAPHANWQWRLKAGQLTDVLQRQLSEWVRLYGR